MSKRQKYAVNYSTEDLHGWFVNKYLLKWVKEEHPEIVKEAEQTFNDLKTEHEQVDPAE